MRDDRSVEAEAIFHEAVDVPPRERSRLLDSRCGEDAELRALVERLLAQHERKDLLQVADRAESTIPIDAEARAQRLIGPYKILRTLGEGGMGTVFLAEQTEPIRRRVALKVIKLGMDSKHVVARFEAERQALALMDHPNIAKVFDAGATEFGRPYFAMEYIKGVPVTEYCDSQRLTLDRRLDVFLEICEGVQHAHQKGVIHRDLKPSNVLVGVHGDRPVPKIIDFGVAKATAQPLTEHSLYTETGRLIGTPEYMSPEQAEMGGLDIDTRTDVYSLGVLLYELLVGARPFDPEELRRVGFDELRRIIREQDPVRPSTRVTILGEESTDAAARRQTDPPGLRRNLRGDLDWIVMRALEKDRTRRYASPAELAADIRRYLESEPVLASSPSTLYRLVKFVRRHRVGVTAGSLVLAAILIGLVATSVSLVRAQRAEREARASELRAEQEAAAAEQVSEFLVDLFEVSDPDEARGNTVTARELLDQGSARIREELGDQPELQARMMHTMGTVYRKLSLYEEARPLVQEALETRRERLGEDHLSVAESWAELGAVHWGRGEADPAIEAYERAVTIREQLQGSDSPEVARLLSALADIRLSQKDSEQARALLERSLAIQEAAGDSLAVAATLSTMAYWQLQGGVQTTGLAHAKRALAIREEHLGTDHPDVAKSLWVLSALQLVSGQFAEARETAQRNVQLSETVFGPESEYFADALYLYAGTHERPGPEAWVELLSVAERALAIYSKTGGPAAPMTITLRLDLGTVLNAMGRVEDALRMVESTVEVAAEHYGRDTEFVALALGVRGITHAYLGHLDTALSEATEAMAILDGLYGENAARDTWTRHFLTDIRFLRGEMSDTKSRCERRVAIAKERLGSDHMVYEHARARCATLSDDREEALSAFRRAVELGCRAWIVDGWVVTTGNSERHTICRDPILTTLLDEARFEDLLALSDSLLQEELSSSPE